LQGKRRGAGERPRGVREREEERMRGRERACARKDVREGGGVEEKRESAREKMFKLEEKRLYV